MRLTLLFSILLVSLSAGCSRPKAPSGEQIEAALNEAVKKDSPQASAKLTDIGMDSNGTTVHTKFTCTNCLHHYHSGSQKIEPSAPGQAVVWLDTQDKRWKFMMIAVDNDDGGKSTINSDHVF